MAGSNSVQRAEMLLIFYFSSFCVLLLGKDPLIMRELVKASNYGIGLNDDKFLPPARPHTRENNPE